MSIEEEEDTSLKELVTKTLQSNGVLGKIQAQLRASVFLALEEEFRDKAIPLVSPPTRKLLGTREGALAASLVHDFLQCLGLDFSLSVFVPESGHPSLWSSHGHDVLSSSLGLTSMASVTGRSDAEEEKGQKTPLLIELLRERETPPSSAREQNGDSSSTSNTTSSSRENQHHHHHHQHHQQQEEKKQEEEEEEEEGKGSRFSLDLPPKALGSIVGEKERGIEEGRGGGRGREGNLFPPLNLENGQKEDIKSSSVSNRALSHTSSHQESLPGEEGKVDSDASLNGEDKQYEDDFSSMSEKEGQEEEEEEEEEEEVEEDIEEDLDDISASDLLNSTESGVSDMTKDQSLSQASNPPAYQEDL